MTTVNESLRRRGVTGLVMALMVGLTATLSPIAPAHGQQEPPAQDSAGSTAVTAPTSFGRSADPLAQQAQPAASDYSPDEEVLSYWTPERLASATPYTPESASASMAAASPAQVPQDPGSGSSSSSTDPDGRIEPVAPQPQGGAAAQPRIQGKLFFNGYGFDNSYCSASVVNTPTKRVVITAGHCVYDQQHGWMKNIVFVPDYDVNGSDPDPVGIWTARSLRTFDTWIADNQDVANDVGFVTLNDGGDANQPVAQAVGAYGLAWGGSHEFQSTIFGYPSNLTNPDGRYASHSCQDSTTSSVPPGFQDTMVSVDSCNFGPGASGGPWLYRYDTTTELGYVRSVTSLWFQVTGQNWAPYFSENVKKMLDETTWD